MENEYLDKVIKAHLEQYDAGEPGNTWATLQNQLDTASDSSFDDSIKNKLNNLEEVYDAATWTSLAAALNQVDTGLAIDELIDSKAKSALENIDTNYDPSTWDVLENKIQLEEDLSNIEIPEEVDLAAYSSLDNLTVPYDESNWDKFQNKLDREFVLPYTLLFKYKFAELSLLLLFLLGVSQFMPLKKANKIFKKENIEILAEQKIDDQHEMNQNSEMSILPKLVEKRDLEQKNLADNNQAVDSSFESTETKNTLLSSSKVNKDSDQIIVKNDVLNNSNLNSLSELSDFNSGPGLKAKSLSTSPSIKSNVIAKAKTLLSKNEAILDSNPFEEKIQGQEALEDQFISSPNLLKAAAISMLSDGSDEIIPNCIVCKNPVSLLRWRMSAQVNADYNYIMTPYDKALSVKSYQHAALGYGAGLATSLGLGRWDIELGANYVSRKYTPKPISEKVGNILDGYLSFELDKIELNLLNVPLHIRYYFKTEKKTEVFISGGASLNIAMQANYYKKAEFASRQRTPNLSKADQLLDGTLINTQKIYSLGLLDGGSFLENRYFTADLGLGFERKISHRYSIFGQANYQHFLDNGIGPNKDRFNSVSLSAGARALFR